MWTSASFKADGFKLMLLGELTISAVCGLNTGKQLKTPLNLIYFGPKKVLSLLLLTKAPMLTLFQSLELVMARLKLFQA